MKLKYLLALLTGLLVTSTTMKADDGAAVTVAPGNAHPNPVYLGSPVSITFHATKTDPANAQKEIQITSWQYDWSASDGTGWTTNQSNAGADWTPPWTPSVCDTQTLTASVTVIFTGTQNTYTPNPTSYTTTANNSGSQSVKVVSISLSMSDGQRIGITANGHDRTQHFSATVCPADEAGNVFISSGPHLQLSNERNQGNGVISFDLVGTDKSNGPGDTYVEADYWTGGSVKKTATVIIPADVGKPHPTFDSVVTPANLVCNATSSPSYFPNPPSSPQNTFLETAWIKNLTIQVVDQFTNPCGDLYDGSIITENGGTLINKTLSGSSYSDPVGPGKAPPGQPTTANDPMVAQWPTMPTNLCGEPPVGKQFKSAPSVEVDGFTLTPGLAGRSYTYMGNNHLKIEWP